jgi:hypothetical protein
MRRGLAVFLCFAVAACGPGLNDIVRLRSLADRAKVACTSAPASGRDAVCRKSLDCAQAALDAAKAIQSHQEAVKAGTSTPASGVVAKGLVAVSDAICAGVK